MSEERLLKAQKKLLAINKSITRLDPAIRLAAFEILAPYYFGEEPGPPKKKADKAGKSAKPDVSSREKFFGSFDHKKPGDNVHLVAAWLYSQHGVFPITSKDISDVAGDIGLTIPMRPDNTMRSAKHNGNNLYKKKKKAKGWQLTVKGEAYMRETYDVKKGTKTRPTDEES